MSVFITLLPRATNGLALIAMLACEAQACAADYTVSIEYWKWSSPYQFNPGYLTIQAGDTVTWVNADYVFYNYHTVYFPASGAYSGLLDVDESVTAQFTTPGTYSYYDYYIKQSPSYYFSGTVVVTAPPPQTPPASLMSAMLVPGGGFQCTVSNLTAGKTYVIERSTNLVDWSGVYTNTANSGVETYVDGAAMRGGRGFYRAVYYSP
jgi:plastocyanin